MAVEKLAGVPGAGSGLIIDRVVHGLARPAGFA
jgi:hypothetical protein